MMQTITLRPAIAAAALVSLVWQAGCTSTQVVRANATPIIHVEEDIPEAQILDLGIAEFDPGIPEDETKWEDDFVYPEVRRAESRFIAYHLKDTLQGTGNWGAVRVVPEPTNAVDVLVSGEILYSDGMSLEVSVRALDATGRVWLDKEYEERASRYAYKEYGRAEADPFQNIYHEIANDLLAARQELEGEQLVQIRHVSELKFAEELSPVAFSGYLSQERNGDYVIDRLPAADDPMMTRMRNVRQREYLFIDTLDDYYTRFYGEMSSEYEDWRRFSYEEAYEREQIRKSARNRMLAGIATVVAGAVLAGETDSYLGDTAGYYGVLGGAYIVKSGFDRLKEAKIHEEAMRELADSFESEIAPMVIDIEGRTVQLSGSAQAQFQEWRRIIAEIYATETGLMSEVEDPDRDLDLNEVAEN